MGRTNKITKDDVKPNGLQGAGRAKRCKGKRQEQDGWPKTESKFNLYSGACTSIINSIPTSASPLDSPEPILTANGPIFPTHSVHLLLTTAEVPEHNFLCFLCQNTDDNLVYVVDCRRKH